MKGIILAGGSGSRLYPATAAICKQLIPVYDKPMIYYPLASLMHSLIREVLIISTPDDLPRFEKLFGTGEHLGMKFEYAVQQAPNGLAESFIIGEEFLSGDSACLVLGDNLFYGHGLPAILQTVKNDVISNGGAGVFGYHVQEPQRYGVAVFNENNNVIAIEEKPEKPKSSYAIPGIYFYDNNVVDIAKKVKPSARGELEITAVNNAYIEMNKLQIKLFGRGFAWFDTGTHESLLEASGFISALEKRMDMKIACIEEIAYYNKWISRDQLKSIADSLPSNPYKNYLLNMTARIN